MRIVLVTHYFEPESGAPQRRWSALIERFVQAGHIVHVFAPPPHYPRGTVASRWRKHFRVGAVHRSASGAIVHRVAYLPHRGDIFTRTLDHGISALSAVYAARRAERAESFAPDVVVATAPAIESLMAGGFIAKRLGVPLVAEMRDAWPDLVAFTPGVARAGRPVAALKNWVHRAITAMQANAAMVVTTTDSFADVLQQRGIARVAVLRNGTTHTAFPAIAADERDDKTLRVLYMGTVGRSQGLDQVIATVARLRRDGVEIACRIVGEGADLARLTRLNRRLGRPVDVVGSVGPAEVRTHYAWADSAIVSLRDWEPFTWTVPSKLYELLAMGVHVTAIVAGEAARIVSNTGAGDVVTPGASDELAELWRSLSKDRARLKIGPLARQWVEENADYDALAAQYLRILEFVSVEASWRRDGASREDTLP